MNWIEILGLVASVFVLASFVFKNQLVIRSINIVGCIAFVVYGILIRSLSVWLLNGILIFVHTYYIVRLVIDLKKKNNNTQKNNTI